ncbi:MAG: acyl-CoA thioesterase [Lentisphaerae bacterium]|nr:acyl-CoA thioesterase [Lentisphaerota bacterium]
MTTLYKLVLPEHLNQYGFLFGGNLLKWIDEAGWMAASLDFPGHHFVTVALDKVEFRKGAQGGNVLRFDLVRQRIGTTSVTYLASVTRRNIETGDDEEIFATHITFVNVDEHGAKCPIRKPETQDAT